MTGRALYARERIILEFLARRGAVGHTHLIKWLFVAREEHGIGQTLPFYDFVPYEFGPFSFTAYHELAHLTRRGLVVESKDEIRLNEAATDLITAERARLSRTAVAAIDSVLHDYGALDRRRLVERVYERHPWFASRSRLTGRQQPAVAPSAVYTLGYEGASVDAFLNRALREGLRRVVDVRRNAYSMKYGFTGRTFRGLCEKVGLSYVHEPDLGIASSLREDLTRPGARAKLFRRYERELLPTAEKASARVADLVRERPSAVVCFEARAEDCHRGTLAPALARRTGLEVVHL